MSESAVDFLPHGRLLADKAAAAPDRPFLLFDDQRITLGELNAWSNRIAHGLLALHLGPGSHVSVMLPNSPRWLAIYFALQKIGAAIVPINVSLKGEGLAYILDHSDSRALILDPEYAPILEDIRGKLPKLEHVIFDRTDAPAFSLPMGAVALTGVESPRDDDPGRHRPERIRCLMYLGTTGLPKGRHTLRVLGRAAHRAAGDDVLQARGYAPDLPSSLPRQRPVRLHDVRAARGRPAGDRAPLQRQPLLGRVPQVRRDDLQRSGRHDPDPHEAPERPDDAKPRRAVMSAACPANMWEAFERRFGVKIMEWYGAVDGAGFLTFNFGNAPVGSIGQPPPGVEYKLVDPNGSEVPVRQPGELVFKIDDPEARKVEYYRNPEASQQKVHGGWLHTGDIMYRDEDSNLYFVDRLNDCMRRRGENVSSYEVEREVNAHPAVLESAAFGVKSELAEDDIMIVVVPRPGAAIDPPQLIEFLRGRMADFMIPRYVDVRPEIPKTETHRVQKTDLKRRGVTPSTWDREAFEAKTRTA
jgi:crotonobetaine/carnitine-CoA ligase